MASIRINGVEQVSGAIGGDPTFTGNTTFDGMTTFNDDATFNTDVTVRGSDVNRILTVRNESSTVARFPQVTIANYSGGAGGHPAWTSQAAAGTFAAPAAVDSVRTLGAWLVQGYNGSTFVEGGRLTFISEAAWSVGSTPTRVSILNAGTSGSAAERMRIAGSGNVGFAGSRLAIGNIGPTANALSITAGTYTTDEKVIDATATWNNAAVTFTGIKLDVTNTASAAGSNLLDLQVGGVSQMRFTAGGQLLVPAGTNPAPGLAAADDPDTGIQLNVSSVGVITNGAFRFAVTGNTLQYFGGISADLQLRQDVSMITFGSLFDTILARDAANILGMRNAANANTFRVYGTFTDSSNYERATLSTQQGASITLAAETAGTGADDLDVIFTPAGAGNVRFGTHSAIGAETVTGFITIKDAGGTSRKLAVVS